MTRSADRMRRFWERAAQTNAPYYVDTDTGYDDPDMDAFFATGRAIVEHGFTAAPARPDGRGLAVELGSGLGRNCKVLAESFEKVVGVDIAPSMVRQAGELVPDPRIRFVLGDGEGLTGVATGSADLVFSFTVFQHMVALPLIQTNITDAGRVLRRGGVFAFQWNNQPGQRSWQLRRAVRSGLQRTGVRRDRHGRNAPEFLGTRVPLAVIERACASAGLQVVATDGLGTLFAWAWARKVD